MNVKVADIYIDDTFNCRGMLTPIDVEELANDIKINGLHQPIVVAKHDEQELAKTGKHYRLIAGFRRTYAHKILKREEIPAVIKEHMLELDARLLNLSENLKRRDLNMLQEALALKGLIDAGMPQEQIAAKVGMSRGWVQCRLYLLRLPDAIQRDAASGVLNQYQIQNLHRIKDTQKQYDAVKKIKDARMRGEKVDNIIDRRPPRPNEKKMRKKIEIESMINKILDTINGNIATVALAWCAGNISDLELYNALNKFNPKFPIPTVDEIAREIARV